MDLETVIQHVGSFGKYQKLLAALLWGLISPFLGFVIYGNMLLLLTPDHWCNIPELGNLTSAERRRLAVPLENNMGKVIYSRCFKYDVNFTQILVESGSTLPSPNEDWPIVPCSEGWEYDYSLIYPTIVSQWNWVCEDAWKTYFSYTMFWAGASVGVVILGFVADMYGRVPVVVAGHLLSAVAGIATNFVYSFTGFLLTRFVMGFVILSQSMTAYVLEDFFGPDTRSVLQFVTLQHKMLEYVGTSQRLTISTGYLYAYPLVGCILPWVAYGLRSWEAFNVATCAPLIVIPLIAKFIPESLRWMVAHGKTVKARQTLQKVACFNGKNIENEFFDTVKFVTETEDDSKRTVCDLLRWKNLRRVCVLTNLTWFFTCVCFTGGYIYAATVSKNPFLMITINSALDIIANLIADRLADRFGRRISVVVSCSIAFVTYVTTGFIPDGYFATRLVTLMAGRLAVTVGYNINYLYAAEVFPTVVRTQALAVRQAMGSIGNFISPQVVLLGIFAHYLPLTVFGSLSGFAAILMVFLPETANRELPEKLEDGESLAKEERKWNCCYFKKPTT
ncbi:organic cation/carnitine transporter 2-like isoform X2 [Tachypleus tridentatus]